jgi:ornithine carbamoyltransferase
MDFEKTRIVIPADVLMQETGGEAVLLHLATEQYHGLDSVGTRMWELLRDSANLQTAYEILLDEYEVEAEQLQVDLIAFIHELAAQKLIEILNE